MRRRFVQINGELVEVGRDGYAITEPQSPAVLPDIAPYRSQIDGSMIVSRSRHREHLRAHGYQEVGNDSSVLNPKPPAIPDCNPDGRKELIRHQVAQMTHEQFKRALQRDLDSIRWNSRER